MALRSINPFIFTMSKKSGANLNSLVPSPVSKMFFSPLFAEENYNFIRNLNANYLIPALHFTNIHTGFSVIISRIGDLGILIGLYYFMPMSVIRVGRKV